MPLPAGAKLSFYELLAPLGAGAMGEVYRAKDTKLGREVAIKVLPPHFAEDAERLKRFGREATTLASLNHPNVAQIFGVDEVDGLCFLVLELVPGESLEERLKRGPLPIAEAIDVGRQIAEGLEAAHEAGVIHRDLKPANVRLTPDGKVKVLDFGLAKPAREAGDTKSSTDSVLSTEAGRLLGTPTYMAPEQARGKAIDRRVDLWAFGCVLYECLTAQRAFAGESLTDVLAAVIEREPDLEKLPAATPPRVRALIERCLRKDAKLRLQAIGEARIALASGEPPRDALHEFGGAALSRARRGRRELLPWIAGATIALLGATSPYWTGRADRASGAARDHAPVVRFTITPPPGCTLTANLGRRTNLAVSPAGDRIVFAAEKEAQSVLCMREIGRLEARVLPHTEGASSPCFSPDGRWIAFLAESTLLKMPADGGPTQTLSDATVDQGVAWTDDGSIVWCDGANGAWRVSASGGTPALFARTGPGVKTVDGETTVLGLLAPLAIPGASYVLACAWDGFTTEDYHLVSISLADGKLRSVLRVATEPRLLAPDRLLFTRGSTVMTVGFDRERGVAVGEATVALDPVRTDLWTDSACIAASTSGAFTYIPGGRLGSGRRLIRVEESGASSPLLDGTDNYYGEPVIAPDGRRAVLATLRKKVELWVLDLERRSLSSLTSRGENYSPAWSRDGARIVTAYTDATGVTSLARWPARGGEPEIVASDIGSSCLPQQELPDGSGVLVRRAVGDAAGDENLEIYSYAERSFTPVRNRPAKELMGSVSPDGQWLVYCSEESGRRQVYVGALRGDGPNLQVSADGGTQPRFSHDGKRVYFLDALYAMWSAELLPEGKELRVAPAVKLFDCLRAGAAESMLDFAGYGVLPDGSFAMVERAAWEEEPLVIHVVLNWAEELRAKVAGR
ncbi:MAG: serine/threonine-protein kinase [Planctomycetes bacterium]|nr:serine/threonine-protein kinase [Planctomycetota bacterium]